MYCMVRMVGMVYIFTVLTSCFLEKTGIQKTNCFWKISWTENLEELQRSGERFYYGSTTWTVIREDSVMLCEITLLYVNENPLSNGRPSFARIWIGQSSMIWKAIIFMENLPHMSHIKHMLNELVLGFFIYICSDDLHMLGCPPAQDSSHHQDYDIFRLGNPNLNLHLPLEYWEGGQPNTYFFIWNYGSEGPSH